MGFRKKIVSVRVFEVKKPDLMQGIMIKMRLPDAPLPLVDVHPPRHAGLLPAPGDVLVLVYN
jgi:hypothetical protein